jgi:cytochrome c peroxidase
MKFIWLMLAAFAEPHILRVPAGLDAYIPVPENNPITRESVELGRQLFFDKRLSRDNSLSCATCHDPQYAFTDPRKLAVGVDGRTGDKRVPRILNRAYGKAFFWDGRVSQLEEQVIMPIANPKEMDLDVKEAATRVGLDTLTLQRALASYVRTILSGNSPYDRYVQGNREALTTEQKLGLQIFRGKAGCGSCHLGPNLTDERFHNTGIGTADEPGHFATSRDPGDRGAFKTPSLREVARTPPYMHDGSLATLDEVIDYYDKGGRANANLDAEIRKLQLSAAEKKALVAFLQALNGVISDGL